MGFVNWSKQPAEGVGSNRKGMNILRGLAARATTPLLPDDYLGLVNPLWSARELRGRIISLEKETEDSATVTIRAGWGFPIHYESGQYVGIGVDIGGRWHWRSYSLTSVGESREARDKIITITVKANPDGFLSSHLVDGVEPGTIIRLAAPKGDFHLPEPVPERILFITAGSGITPVMGMLRSLAAKGPLPDILHIHSAPTREDVIFGSALEQLADGEGRYELALQLTDSMGKFDAAALDSVAPDWRERECWACGPAAMLDVLEAHYEKAGSRDKLHIERFTIARTDHGGEGGTLRFSISDKEVEVDGATTILEAGESLGVQLPFGCRMGICQTCVVSLAKGYVRDLRTGEERREGERIQTCVSAVSGTCTIEQ
ncbi:ferredoxin reductase [Dietzia sp.]|uniref:ferredoxin reductase n=1 Tax=Dietzia sp. TaxID=1871616 RepID=UPI002FD8D322